MNSFSVILLSFSILLVSVCVSASGANVVIKNKYTGLVLSVADDYVETTFYDDKDQNVLWKKEPTKVAPNVFVLVDVATGKALEARLQLDLTKEPVTARKTCRNNQQWKISPKGRITSVAYPNRFLTYDESLHASLNNSLDTLEGDEWLFEEP